MSSNTICAISTAPGIGAIAVIRISGDEAISITDKLFRGKKSLSSAKTATCHYGEIVDEGTVLDEVLCTIFRAPHSFTGEDTVEISCHGSQQIQQSILIALMRYGAQSAAPGEFTKRAFLNGKLDLSQAEAVADLIAADSAAQQRLAISHLKGGISEQIQHLRNKLVQFTSLIELELDFADHEDLTFADRSEVKTLAIEIENTIQKLLDSFSLGNALKNGISVAIIGPVNAGKSTLLNALAGEEKAIVSTIPGTTRDTIEDNIIIHGVHFRFIDTAGLRSTNDEIENIGIQRALSSALTAELVIFLQDITQEEAEMPPLPQTKKVLKVYNKADLPHSYREGLCVSAQNDDLDALKEAIYTTAGINENINDGTIITNARHYDALLRALHAIQKVQEGLDNKLSGELLTMDLHDCLNALGEITGEITNNEILQTIFAKFCIGK